MDLQKVDYGDYQLRVIDPRKRLAVQFRDLRNSPGPTNPPY